MIKIIEKRVKEMSQMELFELNPLLHYAFITTTKDR